MRLMASYAVLFAPIGLILVLRPIRVFVIYLYFLLAYESLCKVLYIETEVGYIPVLHDVVLTF